MTLGAVVAALVVGGGAGFLLADRSADEPTRAIIVDAAPAAATSPSSDRLLVDDGIPAREARAAAQRAAGHVDGKALSIDVDDGRYEVEVQRPDGAIVEVLLDGARVVGVDAGDGDGLDD